MLYFPRSEKKFISTISDLDSTTLTSVRARKAQIQERLHQRLQHLDATYAQAMVLLKYFFDDNSWRERAIANRCREQLLTQLERDKTEASSQYNDAIENLFWESVTALAQ